MNFHEKLKIEIHKFIKFTYKITKKFPKDELFGATSQYKRAALSIMLNYVEGFARRKGKESKIYINFLETSYGSLKECKYLLFFSFDQGWITKEEYDIGLELSDNIGKMLWKTMN